MSATRRTIGKRSPTYRLPVAPRRFIRILLGWYDRHHRDLPWRRTRDPYRIWVSEIMLQQTRIAAALPYYRRFIRTYPTLESLARAEEEDVLSSWAGLGYYRRARNLHTAARRVCEEFDGEFPADLEEALSLPGIGRYTAGAILSISHGLPLPVLDGNVKRLLIRYLCLREKHPGPREKGLWALLSDLVRQPSLGSRVGDFNQALMELGSQVCVPGKPDCRSCPLGTSCQALQAGLETTLPPPLKKRRPEKLEFTVALVKKRTSYLLVRRKSGELLEGFWDFPRLEGPPDSDPASQFQAVHGLKLELKGRLDAVTHQITFRKIIFHPLLARLEGPAPDGFIWTSPGRKGYPIPAYVNKILRPRC